AAAVAANLGFIAQADAEAIVTQTAVGLHNLPTDPCGSNLWPHFSTNNQILPNSEWSSIDTIIAATALLEAQEALNLNSSDTDLFLTTINWNALTLSDNHISHGYWDNCERIESSNSGGWQDFGTESWLVNFGQVYATGTLADFKHTPPTFNGSGFIDELAWLLLPPPCMDRWLFNWCDYSANTSADQLAYYTGHTCYDASLRHFGLSAAEVPDRSALPASAIYQAFGIGGNILANDNANGQLQDSIITPHYAGLSASAKPNAAIDLWQWLISGGIFTPLNNVESYAISTASSCTTTSWNALKGSWNLSLQTLGWGRHLSGDSYPLYEAVTSHDSLSTAMQHMTAFQLFLPITQSGS
ncbi:MAG: hypothetical protein GY943_00775, partial [Chloroflexi bacterium]|nr:hypothetical protein [Chloroflexota bacterium]